MGGGDDMNGIILLVDIEVGIGANGLLAFCVTGENLTQIV